MKITCGKCLYFVKGDKKLLANNGNDAGRCISPMPVWFAWFAFTLQAMPTTNVISSKCSLASECELFIKRVNNK